MAHVLVVDGAAIVRDGTLVLDTGDGAPCCCGDQPPPEPECLCPADDSPLPDCCCIPAWQPDSCVDHTDCDCDEPPEGCECPDGTPLPGCCCLPAPDNCSGSQCDCDGDEPADCCGGSVVCYRPGVATSTLTATTTIDAQLDCSSVPGTDQSYSETKTCTGTANSAGGSNCNAASVTCDNSFNAPLPDCFGGSTPGCGFSQIVTSFGRTNPSTALAEAWCKQTSFGWTTGGCASASDDADETLQTGTIPTHPCGFPAVLTVRHVTTVTMNISNYWPCPTVRGMGAASIQGPWREEAHIRRHADAVRKAFGDAAADKALAAMRRQIGGLGAREYADDILGRDEIEERNCGCAGKGSRVVLG